MKTIATPKVVPPVRKREVAMRTAHYVPAAIKLVASRHAVKADAPAPAREMPPEFLRIFEMSQAAKPVPAVAPRLQKSIALQGNAVFRGVRTARKAAENLRALIAGLKTDFPDLGSQRHLSAMAKEIRKIEDARYTTESTVVTAAAPSPAAKEQRKVINDLLTAGTKFFDTLRTDIKAVQDFTRLSASDVTDAMDDAEDVQGKLKNVIKVLSSLNQQSIEALKTADQHIDRYIEALEDSRDMSGDD